MLVRGVLLLQLYEVHRVYPPSTQSLSHMHQSFFGGSVASDPAKSRSLITVVTSSPSLIITVAVLCHVLKVCCQFCFVTSVSLVYND